MEKLKVLTTVSLVAAVGTVAVAVTLHVDGDAARAVSTLELLRVARPTCRPDTPLPTETSVW